MNIPSTVKPAAYGAAAGAVVLAIVGFTWGGWVTGSTAERMAQQQADAAVVSVLSPICVDKFQQQVDAPEQLIELKKISSWQRGDFIAKGGWATMPGESAANSAVARACANTLGSQV